MSQVRTALNIAATCALALSASGTISTPAVAATSDDFYSYHGTKALSSYQPGDVLATRVLTYHVVGVPTPVTAVQLLYRATNARGEAVANVTTVLKGDHSDPKKAVSYQSFYDSMNPEDGPSRAVAGDVSIGGAIANVEAVFIKPLLASGYTVVLPDTEGQTADFAAGPEYGTNTLDSMRAATRSEATGLSSQTKFGMLGYSGGAIATGWASQLAPTYAPEINKRLVGAAEGGVLVDPAHNLSYVGGSTVWAGIAPMAIAGITRAYDIDFTPYLNDYGKSVFAKMENASIANVLAQYPGLTWKKIASPNYPDPLKIPVFVPVANKINMGAAPTPTIPLNIGQGAAGNLVGTSGAGEFGPGDGVMITGDVRALANQFCSTGNTAVKYTQYNLLSHTPAALAWTPGAIGWINDRFAGKPAPSSCGHIPAGNPLTPTPSL